MSSRTTASNLRQRSNRSVISDIVKNNVRNIDTKIETAHGKGLDTIRYELPTKFGMLNMDKVDQQLLIYSELIKLYSSEEPEGRGLDVEYEVSDDENGSKKHVLKISWLNGMSDAERAKRKDILRSAKK
jgi:uncharacterized protein YjbK